MFVNEEGRKKGTKRKICVQIPLVLDFKETVTLRLRGIINASGWSHSVCRCIVHGVIGTIVPVTKFPMPLSFKTVNVVDKRIEFG